MNKRTLKLEKYGISNKRYRELCAFCEQYPEWKFFLQNYDSTVKSPIITDMPQYFSGGSPTENLAIKRLEYEEKCKLVEDTVKEASEEFQKYLMQSVCYGVSVYSLIAKYEMPLSQSSFYDMRRFFFFLLDKNKKM